MHILERWLWEKWSLSLLWESIECKEHYDRILGETIIVIRGVRVRKDVDVNACCMLE